MLLAVHPIELRKCSAVPLLPAASPTGRAHLSINLYSTQAGWLQLAEVGAQPAPPWHWLAAAGAPLEDLHMRCVVCTPSLHVTEHEVPTLTQLTRRMAAIELGRTVALANSTCLVHFLSNAQHAPPTGTLSSESHRQCCAGHGMRRTARSPTRRWARPQSAPASTRAS